MIQGPAASDVKYECQLYQDYDKSEIRNSRRSL